MGLVICLGAGTQGRPSFLSPTLGDAIPLGLGIVLGGDPG